MTIWRYPHATFMNFIQINFWFFISSGHEVVTHLRFLGVFFREGINRDVIGECQLPKYKIEVSYWATIKFRPLWILIPPRYKEKASDQMQILAILNRRLKEAHKINVVYLGSFFRFKSKSSLQVASVSTDLDPLESRGVASSAEHGHRCSSMEPRPFETWRRNGSVWFWQEPSQLPALARFCMSGEEVFWWLCPRVVSRNLFFSPLVTFM